jgi:hypothetical protein
MSENVGASTSRNPEGLHSLYRDNFTLPYLGKTAHVGQSRCSYRILVCNLTGNSNRILEDNTKIDLREVMRIGGKWSWFRIVSRYVL